MAIRKINIEKLITSSRGLRNINEDDLQRTWSKRDLVDLIVYIIESLKKH